MVKRPVVGWPPIRSYRMNEVSNHAKPPHLNGEFGDVDAKTYSDYSAHNKADGLITEGGSYFTQRSCPRKSVCVKVNMDGFPIGRKIDLNAHQCYQSLANALYSMFSGSTTGVESVRETRLSKLLDGSLDMFSLMRTKKGIGYLLETFHGVVPQHGKEASNHEGFGRKLFGYLDPRVNM